MTSRYAYARGPLLFNTSGETRAAAGRASDSADLIAEQLRGLGWTVQTPASGSDLIAKHGAHDVHIEIKTPRARATGDRLFLVNPRATVDAYVFVDRVDDGSPEFWIVPTDAVRQKSPGGVLQERDVAAFRDNWKLFSAIGG